MYLGIEIGGTKLQLGVGPGDGSELAAVERLQVEPQGRSAGILEQIQRTATSLRQHYDIRRVGFGFGGPVDRRTGRVIRSHQIAGWDDFPLVDWTAQTLGVPAVLGNDCDSAALAEARYGAGRRGLRVLYVTVGTGVGGGLVLDGQLYGTDRPAVAEIGHLRPDPEADQPEATVESLASGTGIERSARDALRSSSGSDARELLMSCDQDPRQLTAQKVAAAAAEGNALAVRVLQRAVRVLGWAVAQAITLTAVDVVVVGGGVSLAGETLFFEPLRREVQRYVFTPLSDSYEILPAALGELVVVHGALALAADSDRAGGS